MRLFFIIQVIFILSSCTSQSLPSKIITESEIQYPPADSLYCNDFSSDFFTCEFPPEPVVDIKKWADYLNKNLGLDSASLDTIPAGRYTVLVQFSIGVEGRLSDISILKDPGYGLSQRIIKVISSCRGLWKLSMSHGRVIKNYRRQPITFVIEQEEECENNLPSKFIF